MSADPAVVPSEATAVTRNATYAQRIAFVCEIAARLHTYGTTSQRLEGALSALSERLGLDCDPWSNPTGIILSFSDPTKPLGSSDTTRVIRLPPGDTNLHLLSEADRIADAVAAGKMSIMQGHAALRALDRASRPYRALFSVVAFGLASGAVAGLWRLPWLDIGVSTFIGVMVGLLTEYTDAHPRMREASEALAGLVAGALAVLAADCLGPINLNSVIIASLVVLLPGMALTNAVNELTSQHLVSGTARFAGAITVVLKLTIGSAIAVSIAQLLHHYPHVRAARPQPDWVEWACLPIAAYAFAVLFKAHVRDYAWVMGAAMLGYLIARFGGTAWGSNAGVFLSALGVTVAGNLFARTFNRPGALLRVPGIIMLVPGGASLRGLMNLVQSSDSSSSETILLGVLNVILSLIAGLVFGNLLVRARRNL